MSNTLSFSGRVELIKTVMLGSLQYWLQSFQFPISVIKALESMLAKFLWRDRMPAWSWEKLCKPKEEGGLAIRKITDLNKAAGIKLAWRCCSSNSIWATWMRKHYVKEWNFWKLQFLSWILEPGSSYY